MKHDMEIIEHARKNAGIIKAVRGRLGKSKNQFSAPRNTDRNVTENMNNVVKVVGKLYRDLYSGRNH